jgi:sodium transport system permease protein
MNDSTSSAPRSPSPFPGDRQQLSGRLKRLVLKELREILRDRRTIITLVAMPILIYPLLAIVFQRFLITSIPTTERVAYDIGVESSLAEALLTKQLRIGEAILVNREYRATKTSSGGSPRPKPSAGEAPIINVALEPTESLKRHVADSTLHVAAIYQTEPDRKSQKGLRTLANWDLVFRAGSAPSVEVLHFVESRLQAYNEAALNEQLKQLGVDAALPAATSRHPISFAGAPAFSLAALIPLILVLMTVTGAVYPAIDLTAGERERGTLETLIAAPVPRLGLLLAKYVAVLTVAVLTALVNMTAMTITAHSTGLATSLFGGGLTAGIIVKVLLLLVLFAAFFSAILLAITSCARSFKEAQAYIIPLMLLCLVPGVLCLMPTLEFQGWMAVTPLVNIVMLSRDLLIGATVTHLAIAAVCSTLFYVAAAIAIAARIFGSDAILYGSQGTWSDLVRRPAEPQSAASLPAALLCLALMFPCYFALATGFVWTRDVSMHQRLVAGAFTSAVVLGGFPVLLAAFSRIRWQTGFGLKRAGIVPFLAAVILGLSIWPIAEEIFFLSEWLGFSVLGSRQVAAAQDMVVQLRTVPWLLLIVTMAIVPAMFEEFCFRGFLFGALRSRLSGTWTVSAAAITFGIFHELFLPGRFLASTFLGLVLGWVRLRAGSIAPGILLHAIHNSLLLSIIYYQDELAARGWGLENQKHLPLVCHVIALIGIAISAGLLVANKTSAERLVSESPSSDLAASKY